MEFPRPCPKCAQVVARDQWSWGTSSTKGRVSRGSCHQCWLSAKSEVKHKAAVEAGVAFVPGDRMATIKARRIARGEWRTDEAIAEAAELKQAELAAKAAWREWLDVRASHEWMAARFECMGKPWSNPRLTDAEQYRIRYERDVVFNLSERIRRQMTKQRKRLAIAELIRKAINRGGESRKVRIEFGYTIAELKKHIEAQFVGKMSWDRYRIGHIHIDHIRPVSSFDLQDDKEFKKCWALENLQPLWAADNLAKAAKRDGIYS